MVAVSPRRCHQIRRRRVVCRTTIVVGEHPGGREPWVNGGSDSITSRSGHVPQALRAVNAGGCSGRTAGTTARRWAPRRRRSVWVEVSNRRTLVSYFVCSKNGGATGSRRRLFGCGRCRVAGAYERASTRKPIHAGSSQKRSTGSASFPRTVEIRLLERAGCRLTTRRCRPDRWYRFRNGPPKTRLPDRSAAVRRDKLGRK